jgi:predicted NAD/FAD-binding protein
MHTRIKRRSIAVIGSGVAGLTAAHELAKHERVTLFEADTRLGGHAHTHHVDGGNGEVIAVDSAFLVHNERTYPTLCALFAELGIATRDTEMSMSVRCSTTGLEYAGARGLGGLFPTLRNLTRPRFLAMLTEVKHFHRAAIRLLGDRTDDSTLREFLVRQDFSRFFVEYFVTPLVAAVWSCPPAATLEYPARYLFTFLDHHGMLTVFSSPVWRTVVGGSATYVDAMAAGLDEVHTGTKVRALRRVPEGVQIQAAGTSRRFDGVVVATHADQALALLAEPTGAERAVLGAIPYATNRARLHTDESVLPRCRRARASWNYLIDDRDEVAVTYDVTRLMRLPTATRFLVTLGGGNHLAPGTVLAEMTYHHPLYTTESLAAQRLLPAIDDDRVVFAGAYHGWGFHEDGAASGLRAAHRLRRNRVTDRAVVVSA